MDTFLKAAPYVAAVAVGAVVALLIVLFDNRREKRQRIALVVSGKLREWGLDWLAGVFECYAIQDYSGLAKAVGDVIRIVTDPPTLFLKLKEVTRKMCANAGRIDPAFAKELVELLQAKTSGPSDPTPTPPPPTPGAAA